MCTAQPVRNVNLDTLATLPVYSPQGTVLPLASLATIRETVDTSTVRRVNGQRTVTLNIIPPDAIALESGVRIVRDDVLAYLRDSGAIPANVLVDISGASDQLDATREALFGNYVVALIIIYLLLVAIFRHWGYPLLIMTTIPLGIGGGIIGNGSAECHRRHNAVVWFRCGTPVIRYDFDAGVSDPDGYRRQ